MHHKEVCPQHLAFTEDDEVLIVSTKKEDSSCHTNFEASSNKTSAGIWHQTYDADFWSWFLKHATWALGRKLIISTLFPKPLNSTNNTF